MEFGFSLIVRGNEATPDTFQQVAERAESRELDTLWLSAHVIIPPQTKSNYVMVPGLAHPPHWKERYWEPFTILGYLAAITSKIRLGTSVLVLPQHNPFEAAKQVAEIDQLSQGRMTFGIGAGWFEEEFEVLGQDYANRGARMNDALLLIKQLWGPDPVNYEGSFYQVSDACFGPKPVQKPNPPIWIAGGSKTAMRRAARFADVFHPVRLLPDAIPEVSKTLGDLCEENNRARDAVKIGVKVLLDFTGQPTAEGQFPTQGRPQDIIEAIRRYQDVGVEHLVFDVAPEQRTVLMDTIERFAQDVRPHVI